MNTVRFIMAFFFFALPAIHNGALGEEVVYVVNGYTHSIPQPNWSTVMMLRGSDLEILQTVTLPAPDAHSIAVTPDGTQLWVTCPNGHHLFVIDAQTFEIIDEFDYSDTINKPMGIAISRDRGEVLVGMHQDDLVVRFDAETRKPLVPPLEAGAEGSFIIFTPDGGRFCLVDQGMSVVKLFRSADRALLRTWNLASPVGLGDAAMSPRRQVPLRRQHGPAQDRQAGVAGAVDGQQLPHRGIPEAPRHRHIPRRRLPVHRPLHGNGLQGDDVASRAVLGAGRLGEHPGERAARCSKQRVHEDIRHGAR